MSMPRPSTQCRKREIFNEARVCVLACAPLEHPRVTPDLAPLIVRIYYG